MWSKTFAMMVRVQGNVTEEQMQDALRKVRTRHAALISAIPYPPGQKQPEGEVFFPLAVRTDCSETDWIEVAQNELAEPFPEPEEPPFARFTLLQRAAGFDLVAGFHHHVCDGMSGMFVIRDILQVLGQPDLPVVPIPALRGEYVKVPDAILTIPRFQRKVAKRVEKIQTQLLHEKQRQSLSPQQKARIRLENSPLARQFVLLPAILSTSQTAALIARCKQEQVSVHSAVCVAWMRAFLAESKSKRTRRMVSSPFNMRQHASPPLPDTSGGFLTIVETTVDCAPERNFWDVTREFKQKFDRGTTKEGLFFQSALFDKLFPLVTQEEDINILVQILFFGQVKYDYSMTNLGRLPIPERNGDLQVEAFYGPLVNSSPLERTVGISTAAGRMSFSFLFRQSMMDPARGKAIIDRAIGLLLEASSI